MKNDKQSISNLFYQYFKNGISMISLLILMCSTVSTQAQTENVSFWISGNSGLYTGGYELDDGVVVGTDINLSWKNHLWIMQMNYAPDYVPENYENYQLHEYSALYGYKKDFTDGSFYVATGVSYLDLKRSALSRAETFTYASLEPINESPTDGHSNFGVPIKIGIMTHLSNRVAIGSAYFANINSNKTYFGYQVSLQFGLFQ